MQVHSPEPATASTPGGDPLGSSSARRALAGFFVSGVLLSFLGAILFSWQHHLTSQYGIVGLYYAGLITGLVGSAWISPALLRRKGLGWTLALACGLAGAAFLYLAFVSPPFSPWWRVAGMAIVGFSAGLLHTAIFHAISPMYRHDPAATVNLAGILFGSGCFTLAILISGTFYLYTAAAVQVWIAVIPALFGWMYWKTPFVVSSQAEPALQHPASRVTFSGLRSTGAVLLSLLLFFQLGNEWALAGWLALFLNQRLGISPTSRAQDAGALLARINGRKGCLAMDFAACPARTIAAGDRHGGHVRLHYPGGDRQPVRRHHRHSACRPGIRADLSPRGGKNRSSFSVLSPRLL